MHGSAQSKIDETMNSIIALQISLFLATVIATTNAFTRPNLSLAFRSNFASHSAIIHSEGARVTTPSIAEDSSGTSLNLFQTKAYGRHYQLEELEDAESASTDIILNEDYTITLGRTDGPFYVEASGTWSESFEDKRSEGGVGRRLFSMSLRRKYISGNKGKDTMDVGEFEYEVERSYMGEITLVGGTLLAMNGEIYDVDEIFGERKVGFFNMIDTTEARKNDSVEK
mmetsp:Transcript_9885/g.20519  ORF Transcript_9885/g.20519 Transcript_9885/m.20519 type:complete len:227 (+) Transcript_9885:31-711(+)